MESYRIWGWWLAEGNTSLRSAKARGFGKKWKKRREKKRTKPVRRKLRKN